MARELFGKYVWLMDTIRRCKRVTRNEINRLWLLSSISDKKPIPRRTFCNYLKAIQDLFNVNIECDPSTFEYYISNSDDYNDSVTSWLLNSVAVSNVLTGSLDVADKIFIEDVPSAKEFLHIIIGALRANHSIKFDYQSYDHSLPKPGIVIEPYFIKIFEQIWYLTGYVPKDKKIKTYALDRMKNVAEMQEEFKIPANFDAESFCKNSFGVIFNESKVRTVRLKFDDRTAKYLRALPIHSTQTEDCGIFTYKLRITIDFINKILSYGPQVTVLEPEELRKMVIKNLQDTLKNYNL